MSYQEKNIIAELVSYILILGFYLLRIFQMIQQESLTSNNLFRLWGIVIVASIIVNIVVAILTHILSAITYAIQTKSDKVEPSVKDERDQLIELKGSKIAYLILSIGIFLSMLTLVFNQPALVMFSLLIFFTIAAEIVECFSRLYFYRRGV